MAEAYAADWLELRRAADHRARDASLIAELGARLDRLSAPLLVDVGCGAGALRHALADAAPVGARWRLIDRDPDLLARARTVDPAAEILALDLADLAALGPALADADAVIASAFFDLASAAWIDRFVEIAPARAVIYAALTYDGRESWDPPTADDASVLQAFHRHQGRDFGLGPALGPGATRRLVDGLEASGREVRLAASDWRLETPRDAALIGELADGIARAVAPAVGAGAQRWRAAPRRFVRIGHWDLLAAPGR